MAIIIKMRTHLTLLNDVRPLMTCWGICWWISSQPRNPSAAMTNKT